MNSIISNTRRSITRCTCSASGRAAPLATSPRRWLSRTVPRWESEQQAPSPTPTTSNSKPLPWFVDPLTLPPTPTPAQQTLSLAPLPPPEHLPVPLHPLHNYLSTSPFLKRDNITFINAREADPENSWTEWVVVTSLKRGREGGLKGAIEGVRVFLANNPLDISPDPSSSATPFAPPPTKPIISGIPTSPSKHARGKGKPAAPSRQDQATGWAMLDNGAVVVHVMSEEAREYWGIEQLWKGVQRESLRT